MTSERDTRDVIRDLGDGLVLRRSRRADQEPLAEFLANTLLAAGEEPPLQRLYSWILDLMSGQHPGFDPRDFTIVEETATGKIVSAMALISQQWSYERIPFRFGQPDVVSTDPAYRRRGLVHAQMEEVHRWSAERGEMVLGITGIPWFYRRYGYEMALSLDAGRAAYRANVPRLEEGEAEAVRFRPATLADLPFMQAMYRQTMARSLLACERNDAQWRFDLEGRHDQSGMRADFRIIEDVGSGLPVGLLRHGRRLWGTELGLTLCEVQPGTPWLAVAPGLLRYLDRVGAETAAQADGEFTGINVQLGEAHPLYDTIPHRLPRIDTPYAWYLRVPDLVGFLRLIAPALARRLAASPQAGFVGEMRLNFFRDGVRLRMAGDTIAVEPWQPEEIEAGDAMFPDLAFLPLLFGFRSLADVQYAYPDCLVTSDAAGVLLPILFPKKPSQVWYGG